MKKAELRPWWRLFFHTKTFFLPLQGWDEFITSLMKSIPIPALFLQGHLMSRHINWYKNIGIVSYKSNSLLFIQALGTPTALLFLWWISVGCSNQAIFETSDKISYVQVSMNRQVWVFWRPLGRVQEFIQDSWWTLTFKHLLKREKRKKKKKNSNPKWMGLEHDPRKGH